MLGPQACVVGWEEVVSKSHGKNGATFHCILMTRADKKPWHDQLESPKDREKRIRKIRQRKEKHGA